MSRRRVVVVTAVLLAAALTVLPAPRAEAAVTHVYNPTTDVLTISSDAAADAIVVTCQGGSVAVGGSPLAGPTVPCAGVQVLNVNGGGGNDVIDTTNGIFPVVNLDGGDGDDTVTGAEAGNPSSTQLIATGGPGNDTLRFTSGDNLAGGDGNDTFVQISGFHTSTTVMQGQSGTDTYRVDLSAVSALSLDLVPTSGGLTISFGSGGQVAPYNGIEVVDLILTDGSEVVRVGAFPGQARVDGRGGNDTLEGGDGSDILLGGSGNDTIEGGDGADSLDAGDGNDVVRARDESADVVACGLGADVAVLDAADTTNGCETRDLGSGTDGIKPKPTFSGAKVSGTKLKLSALCPATELRCVGSAKLTAKGKRNGKATKVKLGDVLIVADGGRKDRLSLVLTPAQRSAVAALTKAKLLIAYNVIDAGGNVGKGRASIRLKT